MERLPPLHATHLARLGDARSSKARGLRKPPQHHMNRSFSIVGLFFASLQLGACGYAGERASTHECPEGETCSGLTPNGVYFDSARTSDDLSEQQGFLPMAERGTMTVTA